MTTATVTVDIGDLNTRASDVRGGGRVLLEQESRFSASLAGTDF
jgi:hypothetical protein